MIKKIIKYKKFRNLINIKSFEVIMSIVSTIILLLFFNYISVYDNFYGYQEFIISFIQGSIFAFIGLIGFLITALSITVGMINRNVREEIIKLEINEDIKENSIEIIIYDFIFLGLIISIEIITYILLLFLLVSNLELVKISIFILVTIIISYLFLFTIFSSVSILAECYDIFLVSIEAEKNNKKRKILEKRYQTLEEQYQEKYNKEYSSDLSNKELKNYLIGFIIYIENIKNNNKLKKLYYDCIKEKYEYEYKLLYEKEESLGDFIKKYSKDTKVDL